MINKKTIVKKIIENLQNELREVEGAAKSSRDLATQSDLKSEGKYDTRAIEASYLAGAQQKRVEEIKIDIQMLEELEIQNSKNIQMGSLALIEHNGNKRYYFLTSAAGGTILKVDGENILVISVFSPLGSSALGLSKDESFEVETPKEIRMYHILKVY